MRTTAILAATLGLLLAGATAAAAAPDDETWLRARLAELDSPARLRELTAWPAWQAARGGGFLGLVPEFPSVPDSVPVAPEEAIPWLIARREANLAAIAAAAPQYPLRHAGRPLPAWSGRAPDGWSLVLDLSVPRAFLDALADGHVSADEAAAIAALPANREMLAHRDALAYLPEPHPDVTDVAELMARVGAGDPLARIWCWLSPWNGFGYADLVLHADAYRAQLDELATRREALTGEAISRVAALAPDDVTFGDRFALTVGWGIRGWATPAMGGLNLEHVKDDWDLLLGTLTEETFHRLQLVLVPTRDGGRAGSYEELATADTGDPALDKLHELLAYTVLEGTANLARGDLVADQVKDGAAAGAALLQRFVAEVVAAGDVDAADGLIDEGLRGNGPLYGLGWHLARELAAAEGPRAVGARLRQGPVAFVVAAAAADRERLLGPAVLAAVRALPGRGAAGQAAE
ncbi:MAG: hypothetical protein R6X35_00310 [Candidatus Krumholzibacteriia bacterium]